MNERFGDKVKAIFDSITVLQAKDSDLKKMCIRDSPWSCRYRSRYGGYAPH